MKKVISPLRIPISNSQNNFMEIIQVETQKMFVLDLEKTAARANQDLAPVGPVSDDDDAMDPYIHIKLYEIM